MDLEIASEADRNKWDALVAGSTGGTIFHTMKYLECLEAHTQISFFKCPVKGKLYPLIAREGTVIVALFPVFVYSFHGIRIIKSGNVNEDLIYLGPVFIDSDVLKPSKLQIRTLRLKIEMDRFFTKELKAHNVQLKISPFYPDGRPYTWSNYDVYPLYTYFFDLRHGPKIIWENFNKGVRKIIVNAQKNGITVESGGPEEAEFIYNLLDARNRTNSPKALVLDIVKTFYPEHCNIFVAKQEGYIKSGVIVLHYGHYAHLWVGFPGSDTDYLGANELLMWEVIKWAHTRGYDILENTGGNDLTTFQFKRKFNPVLMPYLDVVGSRPVFRCYRYIKTRFFSQYKELAPFSGD